MSPYAYPKAGIVCLNLQRARESLDGVAPTVASCRHVLKEARRRGWPVAHVHARPVRPEDGRSIAGLEPRPSEPVFVRHGPSAFSSQGFARMAQAWGGPLALIGFSLHDTVLATAFAAADRKLAVDIVRDAVWSGEPGEAMDRTLAAPLRVLGPNARLVSAADLLLEDVAAFAAANLP